MKNLSSAKALDGRRRREGVMMALRGNDLVS
jgi:hypothetical protein